MTPERWQLVKAELAAALDAAPPDRDAYLQGLAQRDAELFQVVDSLVKADAAHGSRLSLAFGNSGAGFEDEEAEAARWVDRLVGAYRLNAVIGSGGMGTVFRASRDDGAFERVVAVKVIRGGTGRRYFLSRFQGERQILARLEHPSIARLIDGGATEDGYPYLVMEMVEGQPIDEYCDRRGLTVRARLELFRKVCAAVQYAHQNLVVHRDLKPGNILITPAGDPKLLDFGIARIMAEDSDAASDRTLVPMMTLQYASPEQVRGDPITTSTDIYSLGVLLYVLLTGGRPYEARATTPQAARVICEEEPPLPSSIATEPAVRRQLRGDIDSIILKALRKEPAARYFAAENLSDDIANYLGGLPVAARRGSASYQLGKFVRRHRLGVAIGLTATVMLAAALVVVSSLLLRVRSAATETAAALADSRAVADFLQNDVLGSADPEHTGQAELPIRAVLERASATASATFAGHTSRAAAIHAVLGRAWEGLGDPDRALAEIHASIAAAARLGPAGTARWAASMNALADHYYRLDDFTAERKVLEEMLAPGRIGTSDAEYGEALTARAQLAALDVQTDRVKEALAGIEAARADAIRRFGQDAPETLSIRTRYYSTLADAGRYAEAIAEQRSLVAAHERLGTIDSLGYFETREDLALNLVMLGREREALPILEPLYADEVRLFGRSYWRVIHTGNTLAAAYDNLGLVDRAEPLYKGLIAQSVAGAGPGSEQTVGTKSNLAVLYMANDRPADALPLFQDVYGHEVRVRGETARKSLGAARNLARTLQKLNRWPEAAAIERSAKELAQVSLDAKDMLIPLIDVDYARSLATLGQRAEARRLFDAGIAGLTASLGKDHPLTRNAIESLDSLFPR